MNAGRRVLVLTNMYPTAEHPAFGTFVAEQVESLRRRGVDIDVLFINPREGKANYLRGPWLLRRQVAARPYDLIHAHYVFCGLIAATQRRLPVVLTHHGIEVLAGWTAPLARLASRLADATIVTSPAMVEKLPGSPVVIPCGIDTELFRPGPREEARRALGLPPDGKLVLFAGELRPEKRLDLIREAVHRLQEEDEAVQLIIAAGEPHARIPLYMNACDVLVLASDFEGSPMVVKEAMACNLPIVSTDVGDVRQVIGEVEGCFICRQDVDDLAAHLRAALRFGRRTDGRARVIGLSLDAVAGRIMHVYEETLRRHGR